MAKFEGTGAFIHAGSDSKIYDCDFNNTGGLELASGAARITVERNKFSGTAGVVGVGVNHQIVSNIFNNSAWAIENEGDADWLIQGNQFISTDGVYIQVGGDNCLVVNNRWDTSGHLLFDGGSFEGCLVEGNLWDLASTPSVDGVIVFDNGATECAIVGNNIQNAGGLDAIRVETGTDVVIADNMIGEGADDGIVVNSGTRVAVTGNTVRWASGNGIDYDGDDGLIASNVVFGSSQDTTNTFDNIQVSGNRNLTEANKLVPATTAPLTRYGVNVVSGECNMVVGNDLGDPDDYGTDALNDAGANTQLFWPNDATYGDNFTDCGSGS